MGKEKGGGGFMTPKAIANRIKSKGLQKLRWYCQMCQKQCRDENGFKCHTMSEAHQRQLLLFADNSSKFMDEFSGDFHRGYITLLKRRFGTKRVNANTVYQEYINDRDHIHMNATKWLTLSDYVKWLGKSSIVTAEETEKGWFITYIDRDPETLRRQEEIEKKKKLDLDDRQRQQLFLEKQIERAKTSEVFKVPEPTELVRNEDSLLKISFLKPKTGLKSNDISSATNSKEATAEAKPEETDKKDEDASDTDDSEDDSDGSDDGSSNESSSSNSSSSSSSHSSRSSSSSSKRSSSRSSSGTSKSRSRSRSRDRNRKRSRSRSNSRKRNRSRSTSRSRKTAQKRSRSRSKSRSGSRDKYKRRSSSPTVSKKLAREDDRTVKQSSKSDVHSKSSTESSSVKSRHESSSSSFQKPTAPESKVSSSVAKAFSIQPSTSRTSSAASSSSKTAPDKRKSALDEIMEMNEKTREKMNRKDYWLHKDIVVKINTKALGEKCFKKKGIVIGMEDKYTGIVKLIETGAIIKIDQAHLETVLPALGKEVLILNGAYRGEQATLDQINQNDFSAKLTISAGPLKGRVVNNVQYEDISKLVKE